MGEDGGALSSQDVTAMHRTSNVSNLMGIVSRVLANTQLTRGANRNGRNYA